MSAGGSVDETFVTGGELGRGPGGAVAGGTSALRCAGTAGADPAVVGVICVDSADGPLAIGGEAGDGLHGELEDAVGSAGGRVEGASVGALGVGPAAAR